MSIDHIAIAENRTIRLTPGQRELLKVANRPIGSVQDARSELAQLEAEARTIAARVRYAQADFDRTAGPVDGVSDDFASSIRAKAEREFQPVETAARRDLAVLQARCRSIVAQLDVAAAIPGLANVPAATLDDANRQRPLVEAQLAGASVEMIRARLSAAVIRGDEVELLALVTVVGPILDQRKTATPDDAADPETFALFEAKADLRAIAGRWRDRSRDLALDAVVETERKVSDAERAIVKGFTTRTGKDEFNYAESWLSGSLT